MIQLAELSFLSLLLFIAGDFGVSRQLGDRSAAQSFCGKCFVFCFLFVLSMCALSELESVFLEHPAWIAKNAAA